jgi:hypothetical protein
MRDKEACHVPINAADKSYTYILNKATLYSCVPKRLQQKEKREPASNSSQKNSHMFLPQ